MLNALVSILTAGTISSGDAQKLQKECEGGASTAPLMQPTVLRLLLYSLFDPSRPPKPGTKGVLDKYAKLVASAHVGATTS